MNPVFPNPFAPTSAQGPLSDGHLAELTAAKLASKRLRRTASVARASSMTTGIFAAITLLSVLIGDMTSLVLGAALLVISLREGKLAARLARFEPGVPRLLAFNQLILGAVVIVYAIVQAHGMADSNGLSQGPTGDAQVDAMMGDIGSGIRSLMIAFYLCVAMVGATSGGLMAWYYSRCSRTLVQFLAETPEWVLRAMLAAG